MERRHPACTMDRGLPVRIMLSTHLAHNCVNRNLRPLNAGAVELPFHSLFRFSMSSNLSRFSPRVRSGTNLDLGPDCESKRIFICRNLNCLDVAVICLVVCRKNEYDVRKPDWERENPAESYAVAAAKDR
jgi:hypothetical protein